MVCYVLLEIFCSQDMITHTHSHAQMNRQLDMPAHTHTHGPKYISHPIKTTIVTSSEDECNNMALKIHNLIFLHV